MAVTDSRLPYPEKITSLGQRGLSARSVDPNVPQAMIEHFLETAPSQLSVGKQSSRGNRSQSSSVDADGPG